MKPKLRGNFLARILALLGGLKDRQLLSTLRLAGDIKASHDYLCHYLARIPDANKAQISRINFYGNVKTIAAFKRDPTSGFFLDGKPYAPPINERKIERSTPQEQVEAKFGDREAVLTTKSLNIKTLEDALRVSKVDMETWEVDRFVVNSWEVTIGAKNNDRERPGTYTNYQVKVWLKRKAPTVMEVAIEELLERLKKESKHSTFNIQHRISNKGEGRHMLEVSLFDAHFGLLAWRRETGDDYDLKLAEESYACAMDDLLIKTQGCQPEKILLPFGNDFFHVNNPEGVTPTAHNILDVDGRLAKVVESGEKAMFRAIDRCLEVAPVEVIWIPGNHDPQTSYFMCRIIQAQYHGNPNVKVNVEPCPRKYVRYGCNLIGYTHGNGEKFGDLPTVMASENREAWSECKHFEIHLGHYHKKMEMRYSAGDTFGGVQVKVLPSISGTDAWHFSKGYVKGNRMAEAYLFDFDRGPVATYCSQNLRYKTTTSPRPSPPEAERGNYS